MYCLPSHLPMFGLFSWGADYVQIHIRVPLASDAAKLVGWRPTARLIVTSVSQRFRRLSTRIAEPFRRQRRSK